MSNNLIPQELDALIQEYLTDGVLTDKERQVILKKAERMGLDRDEIDLYLDAQVQKIDQQTDAAARRQKGKQCPYCGAAIPQLADKCPECGQHITPEASSELQEIIEKLEDALIDFKSGRNIVESKAKVDRFIRKARLYYENNPKVKKLLEEIEKESALAEKNVKSFARQETTMKVLSNKNVWGYVTVIVGVILLIYGFNNSYTPGKYGIALGCMVAGIVVIILGVNIFRSKKKTED